MGTNIVRVYLACDIKNPIGRSLLERFPFSWHNRPYSLAYQRRPKPKKRSLIGALHFCYKSFFGNLVGTEKTSFLHKNAFESHGIKDVAYCIHAYFHYIYQVIYPGMQ